VLPVGKGLAVLHHRHAIDGVCIAAGGGGAGGHSLMATRGCC
jgi:hypothetical protein